MSTWVQASESVLLPLCCIKMSSLNHSAVVATQCSPQPGSKYPCMGKRLSALETVHT